jgi:exopolyphosphatase/guanosine-5'-triphosphate,3'-diphosphate pyrophosphatase
MCWLQTHAELPKSLNGIEFTRKQLDEVTLLIISTSPVERINLAGMDAGRVDIILAGALILQSLAYEFGITSFTYSDYALREGVLLDAYRRLDPEVDKDLRHVAIDGARKLAARCDDDINHSANVARLSCTLFDELSKLFEIEPHNRLYLETAALLANVGLVVSHARHHLHTYYIVRNADLVGFTDHEIELVAQIARYHRKSEPKLQHNSFAALSTHDQDMVRMLAAILRIGIGLDRTHDGRTTSLKVSMKQSQIQIAISGDSGDDLQLNLYAAQQRTSLLGEVFQSPVVVTSKA